MARRLVISDTHFGHEFLVGLRGFASVEDMNQAMIDAWCDTVSAEDTIYHLGDVVMNRRYLAIIPELPGRKILIKGNHDGFKLRDYLKAGFEDIRACVVFPGAILTHIPIHPDSLSRFGANIHGHLHANSLNDGRYVNVSVEKTDYRPLLLASALSRASGVPS